MRWKCWSRRVFGREWRSSNEIRQFYDQKKTVTNMVEPGVFYVKCRPQGCDAVELAKKYSITFIGYPIWKNGWEAIKDPRNVSKALIHPKDRWERQNEIHEKYCSKRKASENHNLYNDVVPGSFIIVPRVREGLCYIGIVDKTLEIVSNLPWLTCYFEMREKQGLSCEGPLDHAADVCQVWHMQDNGFEEVALHELPGWILYRLMARNTVGRIYDSDGGQPAFEMVRKLYKGQSVIDLSPTKDIEAIKRRLEDKMMPPHFEHLCVDLLNLERPDEKWWHTGGVADGGADGIAIADGRRSVLQCKLHLHGDPHAEANLLALTGAGENEFILTSLFHPVPDSTLDQGVTFWDSDYIAALVLKHADRLPMAKALGIHVL